MICQSTDIRPRVLIKVLSHLVVLMGGFLQFGIKIVDLRRLVNILVT